MRHYFWSLLVCLVVLSLQGCATEDDGGDGNRDAGSDSRGVSPPPASLHGVFDVSLSGYWTGTTVLSITESSASFENLVMTAEGWSANIAGPYDAQEIYLESGIWIFKWDLVVPTNGQLVRQQWEANIPEASITESGFTGDYTHSSDFTGTHTGSMVGAKR